MKKNVLMIVGTVLAFLALSYGFVPEVLTGKIVNQSDISGWQGSAHELLEWNKNNPDSPALWTDSLFGGMPTTTLQPSTKGDVTQKIYDVLLTGRRPATYLFISLLGAWLLMLAFGVSPIVAVLGAIAITFCSYNLQIIQVGHNTKMQAIAFFSWVLAALVFTYRSALSGEWKGKRTVLRIILGSVLFAFALSFQIKANHPQISYYLALLILLYIITLIVWIIRSAQRGQLIKRFLTVSVLLLVMGCCGIATNASKLLPTVEYTPYSMRGGSSSVAEGEDGSKGLKLDYATAWSYGWDELPNLMIPNFNGGSSAGAINPKKSETCDLLRRAGQKNIREISKALPFYWGPQPFTAGPMYMGAITVFLFVLGLMLYRGKEKWWLLAATLLSVFLSLGCNFMWFTRLFYDIAPLYNKFRTVSMALVTLQIVLPLLACLVLDKILHEDQYRDEFKNKGWVALAITGGFCLLCAVIPGIAGSFTGDVDYGQPDILVDALVADRRSLLVDDAVRSLIFILAAWGILVWCCRSKQTCRGNIIAASLICVLVVCDLFPIGKRYLNSSHFTTPRNFSSQFTKRPVDEIILRDTDPSYRVLDLTVNVFNDSHPSYWHKNIGGYSPAKMQIYQEYIENHLQGEISAVNNAVNRAVQNAASMEDISKALPFCKGLSKLNCRYIIIDGSMPPVQYPYACGAAWFAEGDDKIEMTQYSPNSLSYKYSSESGGKVVMSEVYYPKGWHAYLDDGTELPVSMSDELFRSVEVPAGEHQISMTFTPVSYGLGKTISLAFSCALVFLLALSAALFLIWRKEWK